MFSSTIPVLVFAAIGPHFTSAVDLDVNDVGSIKAAARTIAYGLQSYYTANSSGPATSIGTFPPPSYWWMGGAIWGGMVDYWAYTDDASWNDVTSQALVAQANAPADDYMPPAFYSSLGNDDQTFWALSAMAAEEYGFPTPQGQSDTYWRDLAVNVFNTQVPRWETSACGGGLRWQIFASNGRFTYKNSVSTGSFFQLAALLARSTGNQTYADWAVKAWDWMQGVGFIDSSYYVYDGADMITNCTSINPLQWSYNPALLIYGTTLMGAVTSDPVWKTRTDGLLGGIEAIFFSPYPNATDIMWEAACEGVGTCNYDQVSFKAYLSRWLAKAAVIDPSISGDVTKYIQASAQAAAQACTGGSNGQTCGLKWYTGGFDGNVGPGQSLAALEVVQALLVLNGAAARIKPNGDATIQAQSQSAVGPSASSTYTPALSSPAPATTETPASVSSSQPGLPAISSKSTATVPSPSSTYESVASSEAPDPTSSATRTSFATSTAIKSQALTDSMTIATSEAAATAQSTSTYISLTMRTLTHMPSAAAISPTTSMSTTSASTSSIMDSSKPNPFSSSVALATSSTSSLTTSRGTGRTSTITDQATTEGAIPVQSTAGPSSVTPGAPTSSSTDSAPRATDVTNLAAVGALIAGLAIFGV